ncbi:TerB family tellurite resistance protein [Moorena sp. SIO2C4]|uniref:tellurite resistance TerB family protein n=1 Tax=Moorena sp. SIO2C4 TaxID=2607824 RepID=UPI0013BFC50C|nr:TerB family tellurite resistance protein [Moorena sp. SIO2C4]NEQ14571.1 TerB family tellurite resistance protein [Moorena sp. SIO3E2]NES45997.1 TerB family tellurite resistance protein [Moorena sp. SIO2C4]
MVTNSNVKQLLKILIGAAWIDGKVQAEEREYLYKVAQEYGVADDPEIKPLLYELKAVSADECYSWVEQYLGDRPSPEDYQRLIEALSALIYSDGLVDTEEAKLLNRLQLLDPSNPSQQSSSQKVLKAIQKIYRRWINKQFTD